MALFIKERMQNNTANRPKDDAGGSRTPYHRYPGPVTTAHAVQASKQATRALLHPTKMSPNHNPVPTRLKRQISGTKQGASSTPPSSLSSSSSSPLSSSSSLRWQRVSSEPICNRSPIRLPLVREGISRPSGQAGR